MAAAPIFVMLGGMLAGHDECEGEIQYEEVDGERRPKSMVFYGMSSNTAMKKYAGGVAHYRASEGKTVEVAYRGSVDETMPGNHGRGVRSMMTYIGATRLKEVPKRTTFVMVGAQLNTRIRLRRQHRVPPADPGSEQGQLAGRGMIRRGEEIGAQARTLRVEAQTPARRSRSADRSPRRSARCRTCRTPHRAS